jgi:hypothetical protein
MGLKNRMVASTAREAQFADADAFRLNATLWKSDGGIAATGKRRRSIRHRAPRRFDPALVGNRPGSSVDAQRGSARGRFDPAAAVLGQSDARIELPFGASRISWAGLPGNANMITEIPLSDRVLSAPADNPTGLVDVCDSSEEGRVTRPASCGPTFRS